MTCYEVTIEPEGEQICVVYTTKGICLAFWSDIHKAFITPHFLSQAFHDDVLYWQPLDIPIGIPIKFLWKETL